MNNQELEPLESGDDRTGGSPRRQSNHIGRRQKVRARRRSVRKQGTSTTEGMHRRGSRGRPR